MKTMKFLALGLAVLLLAGFAQAGSITPGLESQLRTLQDDDLVTVLVVMSRQADIRSLDWELHDQKAPLDYRHQVVLETLQNQAKESQAGLLDDLEAAKSNGRVRGFTSHWIVNGVVVNATVEKVRELSRRADVERIEANLVVELIEPIESPKNVAGKDSRAIGITPGVVAVGARRVWNELGIDGSGVIVGVLDTGVNRNHIALMDRWQGNFADPEHCWRDVAGLGHSLPEDSHGHGTHVMGTITGLAENDTIGVAPGATWIATNVINMGTGETFDNAVIASLEFMADPDGDTNTTNDLPVVVQNSWGVNENFSGYYDCDSRWWDAIDNCEAAGVCLTWSAGNEGPGSQTVRSPGDRAASPYNCFSVGSTVTYAPYTISDFSSRGPSGCGGEFAMKPEIVAPGSDIYSCDAFNTTGYTYKSGTSMAGPHLAGVVALMRAANPNVDVITIKQILMDTAIDLGATGEDNVYGHGMVDAYQAVLTVADGIGTIEGYVTNSVTDLPLVGAKVQKVGANNFTYTDENGFYSMSMPAGDAQFTVSHFGYATSTISVTIPDDDTINGDVSLVQLPSGIVSGHVYGPDGLIVPGAIISAVGTPLDPAVADAAGFYSLELPSGPGEFYLLRGRASGLGYLVQNVEVTGDLTLDFNLPEQTAEDFESGNFLAYPWEMSADVPWVIHGSNPYEGEYCAKSGGISHNDVTELSLTMEVTGEAPLTFYYKVSSENNYDYLRFYFDGTMQEEWSGEVAWTQYSMTVEPGAHTFTWAYEKDGSVDGGDDAAYLDFIEFPPNEEPGAPAIELSAVAMSANLPPNGTETQILTISNTGDAPLEYSLALTEVLDLPAPVSTVPYADLVKGEVDTRAGVSPVTGTGGPDAFGYSWMDSDEPGGPIYNWVDISGTGTAIALSDDGNEGPFGLGFDFNFYGRAFDSLNICTNGWVSFTTTTAAYNNQGIPQADEPNNLLAPFWDDMDPVSGGQIFYEARNEQFIVQYQDVEHYPSGNPETFQVILNSDGSIVYQYQTVALNNGCTVGVENGEGDDGLEIAFNASYLHDEMAIRIVTAPPLTWVTADPLSGTIPEAGSEDVDIFFDATDLANGTYNAVLLVTSNTPGNALVELPVTLIVDEGMSAVQGLPGVLTFKGAVPNPFNPMTEIKFSLPRETHVSLKVYDISGRLIQELVNQNMGAGEQSVRWMGRDNAGKSVASGTYFMRLVADGETSVKSMVLVR